MNGTCENYCPISESKLRIKEKLIHFYECKNGEKNVPGNLIKEFSRSAAGIKRPKPIDLRTESCLKRTTEYLLSDILLDTRRPYCHVYDFIFDRLRAVRQEIVIQDFSPEQSVSLLEPNIMFLAYSRYRLCEEPISNFDAKICDQHLQECLKRALCCYDQIDEIIRKDTNCKTQKNNVKVISRTFIESIYVILNLGSTEALQRALTIPSAIRKSNLFSLVFSMSLNFYRGNVYRVLQGLRELPHILCALAATKLPIIRASLYAMCSHAYNNKVATVPLRYLTKLSLQSDDRFLTDCKYYNIRIIATSSEKAVQFRREEFRNDASPPEKYEEYVEEKLRMINLPEVCLLKKL